MKKKCHTLLFSTYLVVSYLRCGYGFKLQQASPDLLMSMQQPSCPWSVASLPSSCAPDIRIHTGYNLYIYIYNKVLLFSPCSLNHPRFWTWNQGFSNLDNDPRSLRASITLISCDLDWFGHATSIIKLRVPSMTPLKWLGAASGVDLAPKADVPMICPSLLGYFTRGTSRSLEVWLIHTSMYHVSAARIVGTGVDAATSPTKEGYKPTVFASSLNKS